MHNVVNNGASTLRQAHASGDGLLLLQAGEGPRFGAAFPMRVTVVDPGTNGFTIFDVTGRTGDDLSVSGAIEGTADAGYPIGAVVENRWTAGAVAELPQTASANTFTAAQTIHAHAAVGVGSAIDQGDPDGWTGGGPVGFVVQETAAPSADTGVNYTAASVVMVQDAAVSTPGANYHGLLVEGTNDPGADLDTNGLYGAVVLALHQSIGYIAQVTALQVQARMTAAGTTDSMIGLAAKWQNQAGGTPFWADAIVAGAPQNGGTVTRACGVRIQNQNVGTITDPFNLLSEGATSRNAMEGSLRIGANAIDPSALLDVQSTTHGVLIPRMTTTERNAIVTPADGLMVFDSTLQALCIKRTADWLVVGGTPGILEAEEAP